MNTKSPWLHQLKRTRALQELSEDTHTSVVIVGGGIAGIASAYYILRDTPKQVVLLEATHVAHGATGHNAGQLTTYFEQPFASLVDTFGLTKACSGQADIESSWLLLEEIREQAKLKTQILTFTGYAGCQNYEQTMRLLLDNWLRLEGGLNQEQILIADNAPFLPRIPKKYLVLLEQGAFRDLPKSRAYRLAYVKAYATFLSLNPDDAAAQFEREEGLHNTAMVHPVQRMKYFPFSSVGIFLRNSVAVCLVLIFAGYLTWQIKGILEPPTLTVFSPAEGSIVTEASTLVEGVTEAESQLAVNGQEVIMNADGKFEAELNSNFTKAGMDRLDLYTNEDYFSKVVGFFKNRRKRKTIK
jgi:hypothetical protein